MEQNNLKHVVIALGWYLAPHKGKRTFTGLGLEGEENGRIVPGLENRIDREWESLLLLQPGEEAIVLFQQLFSGYRSFPSLSLPRSLPIKL